MADHESQALTYGPALAAVIRARQAEPGLEKICRLMRGGILAHPWTQAGPVTAWLETVKPPHRERAAWRLLGKAGAYMARVQEVIRARYDQFAGSAQLASCTQAAQDFFAVLFCEAQDPERGGPNVMMSTAVAAGAIERAFGRKYPRMAITRAWKQLAARGIITVTPGVAMGGFDQARSNVYHLIPDDCVTSHVLEPGNMACNTAAGPSLDLSVLVRASVAEAVGHVRRLRWVARNQERDRRKQAEGSPA